MRATLMIGSLIAATLASAACHTMRPVTLDELSAGKPSKVWVTLTDQSVVVVEGPQAFGDTLVGYVGGVYKEMPTDNMDRFRVRKINPAPTAALVLAGAAGMLGFATLMTGADPFVDPANEIDCDDDPDDPRCG